MALHSVHLSPSVYMVCLNHALTTEKEEVMGLLIGEVSDKKVAHVSAVVMLLRSDKRKDRVEISPEQLTDATTQAEYMAHQLGQPMRVLGWYHSHPHITVWPSHVDVQTQAMYQMMDECFVGLVFSVFCEDKQTKLNQIQVTCFQAINQSPEGEHPQYIRLEIPFYVMPSLRFSQPCIKSLVQVQDIFCEEESKAFTSSRKILNLNALDKLHNEAVFTKSLCHITEVISCPLLQSLEQKEAQNLRLCEQLLEEKKGLLKALQKAS